MKRMENACSYFMQSIIFIRCLRIMNFLLAGCFQFYSIFFSLSLLLFQSIPLHRYFGAKKKSTKLRERNKHWKVFKCENEHLFIGFFHLRWCISGKINFCFSLDDFLPCLKKKCKLLKYIYDFNFASLFIKMTFFGNHKSAGSAFVVG